MKASSGLSAPRRRFGARRRVRGAWTRRRARGAWTSARTSGRAWSPAAAGGVRACGRADKVRSADGHGMVRRGAGWVVQRHLPCLASELKYTPTPCGQAEIRVRAPCARDAGLAGEGEGGVACSWEAHRRIRNVRRGPAAACGRPAPTRRARCGGGAERGWAAGARAHLVGDGGG